MKENNTLPSNGNTSPAHAVQEMKANVQKRVLGTVLMTAVLVGLVALIGVIPAAVSAGPAAPQLEGTWRTTATITNGPPPFSGLNSFNSGGTFYGTDETQLLSPSAGPAVGVWTKVGNNQYAFTWESYLFDFGTNTPTGKLKVHGVITLIDRNTYTSTDQFEFYDTAGNVTMEGCATEMATRMTVDPVTACPGLSRSGTDSESKLAKGWKD